MHPPGKFCWLLRCNSHIQDKVYLIRCTNSCIKVNPSLNWIYKHCITECLNTRGDGVRVFLEVRSTKRSPPTVPLLISPVRSCSVAFFLIPHQSSKISRSEKFSHHKEAIYSSAARIMRRNPKCLQSSAMCSIVNVGVIHVGIQWISILLKKCCSTARYSATVNVP